MNSSDFCSSDQSSSVESALEDDGGLFVEESFFGPKPWNDVPLTRARLAKVVSEWVCKDWKLRPGQFEVVEALRPSGRVFCGFPTAAGKTLIACANALIDFTCGVAGVYVICQPLQALVGQTAVKLTTSYFAHTRIEVVVWDDHELDVVADIDFANKVVVILSSPEELDNVFLLCERNRARIRGLMIDEAHLRAEWPFRNYLASDRFTSVYPSAMVGIFSATLEKSAIDELKTTMGLIDCAVFDRDTVPALKNLELQRLNQFVFRCCLLSDLKQRVLATVNTLAPTESIIVFASTYDVLSSNYDLLFCSEIRHLNPRAYAASFDKKTREGVVQLFSSGHCRFVIATCAFGTGIDFPNIRAVFFDHAPRTWSSFMQHAGRAGRGDFSEDVFVTMACSPADLKFADRRVQVIAFYCPSSKGASSKGKLKCPDCQSERVRPPLKNAEFSGRCFEFEGVACNTTRQSCLRTIAGFFQGLYNEQDLVDRTRDCGKCSACNRQGTGQVRFVVGNKARVNAGHVKHAGFRGVVATVGPRIALRSEDGIQHALAPAGLCLESAGVFPVPKKALKNSLDKDHRSKFASLIRGELLRADLQGDALFCANVAREAEIQEASKLTVHRILPLAKFQELLCEAGEDEDVVQFDHVRAFKAFALVHEKGLEAASAEQRKRARIAVKECKKK